MKDENVIARWVQRHWGWHLKWGQCEAYLSAIDRNAEWWKLRILYVEGPDDLSIGTEHKIPVKGLWRRDELEKAKECGATIIKLFMVGSGR